jgi:hypothetical protein
VCGGRNFEEGVRIAVVAGEWLGVVEGIGLLAMERTVVGVVGSTGLGDDWFGLVVVRRGEERSVVGLRISISFVLSESLE